MLDQTWVLLKVLQFFAYKNGNISSQLWSSSRATRHIKTTWLTWVEFFLTIWTIWLKFTGSKYLIEPARKNMIGQILTHEKTKTYKNTVSPGP